MKQLARSTGFAAILCGLVLSGSCAKNDPDALNGPDPSRSVRPATKIFRGGPVLTLDADNQVAEALAIIDEEIAAVGSEQSVLRLRGPDTEVVDLAGRTLLPGFIDAHGHLTLLARYTQMVNVSSPPVGPVQDIANLRETLRRHIDEHAIPAGQMVLGYGYDDALLAEQRHPNKIDLDAVSTQHPILLLHVSAHLASANQALLDLAGIDATTEDLPGGRFRRVEDSREPNGVMEEHAMYKALTILPTPTAQQMLDAIDAAQREYAKNAFTTVQDGATGFADWQLLRAAGKHERLFLDVVAFPIWNDFDRAVGALEAEGGKVGDYDGHLVLRGGKIVLDGSPQGKTAWLSQPYYVGPPGEAKDYAGYPAFEDEAVYGFAKQLHQRNWPILAHANGDAAAEQWIRTVERIQDEQGAKDWRPVMIHAQALRHDQLPRMVPLGMIPSFFVAHTFYWGDWHRDSVFGPERGPKISPARTALAQGLDITIHNDAPIVPPRGTFLLWTAVNRKTRSGQVLGPAERLTPLQALRAITTGAAYQHREEARKGSLEVGKLADLVILSANPLEVPPDAIRDIEVIETIKNGRSVYPLD